MKLRMTIPLILIVILVFLLIDNSKIRTQLNEAEEKYMDLQKNSMFQVEEDVDNFLKGFYNYKDRPKLEQIEEYTSKELQKELFQTYEIIDEEENDSVVEYESKIENVHIYHAQDIYNIEKQANVLARFDSIITLNGKEHKTLVFAEIILEKEDDKWLVTKYKQLKGVEEFEGH